MNLSFLLIYMRRSIYRILFVFDVVRRRHLEPIVIFAYHSIATDDWRFSVDREEFVRQVEFLLTTRKPVTLSDVYDHIAGTQTISEPSFVLCFDDGYRDILSVREFLAERGIRPALFVLSDTESADMAELGTRREFLRPEDISALHEDGWDIGCHSATHGDFWNMDIDRTLRETRDAKQKLESELGIPIQYFAYPRGRYTQIAKDVLREAGYRLALSMDDGYIVSGIDPLTVPRVGVDRTHSFEEFPSIFSPSVIRLRRVVKRIFKYFF